MEFPEAIRLAIRERVFDYSGRSRRSEYWWYWAFYMGVWFVSYFVFIGAILIVTPEDGPGVAGLVVLILYGLLNLGLLIPGLSLTVRRLHDLDRTGWWVVTVFIPFVGFFFGIMLLIWFAQDGTDGPNRFGLDPKGDEVF